ncbi:MAG: tRNA (N6-threonylcarbamoyladenosine(37)-N6)-methyltransferase TrmO [Clostridiales bacterium]|nr:tRNA (N6-threonylcarbamoyladenosine(37)-N6)-methyltransferase TrmO [Clostridiales bacterium]
MDLKIAEIGYVENEVTKQMDLNWGSIISKIRVINDYVDGLKGLENFSHAIILTYLHEAKFVKERHLERRPRNLQEMPLVGIFSQRAKDRPNPIGVTTVKIIEVLSNTILVEGLDAINGTPVLDIKPYYPQYDMVKNAIIPEWVNRLMKNYF